MNGPARSHSSRHILTADELNAQEATLLYKTLLLAVVRRLPSGGIEISQAEMEDLMDKVEYLELWRNEQTKHHGVRSKEFGRPS